MNKYLTKRNILFGLFLGLVLFLFSGPLRDMAGLTLHNELYSHIPLVPLISLFLLYIGHFLQGVPLSFRQKSSDRE